MRPAITWLITDTHFNHALMVECGRPADFKDRIVANCRSFIAPQDTLYHLGDVIFYNAPELVGLLGQIPGRKILVRGNHDKKSNGWFERNGFHYVADTIQLGEVVLSHKPLQSFPDGAVVNIHGHFHDNNHRVDESAGWYDPARHFKLAVEDTEYRPVQMAAWLAERRKLVAVAV